MSNSSLVSYTKISPHKSSPRNHVIDSIAIHCMAGHLSLSGCGNVFQNVEASSNYGIDDEGKIGLFCEEKDRSWCTSSSYVDNRAVTIEVANDNDGYGKCTDAALNSLIKLCADICKRNGITKMYWFGNRKDSENYARKKGEGVFFVHRWYAQKSCPNNYLYEKHQYICNEVNKLIAPAPPKPKYTLTCQGHVQSIGWQSAVKEGDMCGTTGQAKRLEAFVLNSPDANFTYQVHMQTYGDRPECKNGEIAGSMGISKRIESVKINCDKPILYRVHQQSYGWTDWVKNGAWCGVKGKAKRIEAIEVKFNN